MRRIAELSRNRKGQIMFWGVMTIPAIAVVLGLSLDVGMIYDVRRRMQTAADGAARSGAAELARSRRSLAVPAALQDAARAGFANGDPDITVNATNPPGGSGPRAGDNNFIQVVISENVDTYFMKLMNRDMVTVRARAVAGILPTGDACIMALNRTARGSTFVNGTPSLTANCGIMTNSADGAALDVPGGSTVTASWVGVTGGVTGGGAINPTPQQGVPPMVNPLAYMGTINPALFPPGRRTGDVYEPGVYNGPVTISGGPSDVVTLNPGIYVFRAGLRIEGQVTVIANGVTLYLTNEGGSIDIGGSSNVTLTAPTSGPTQGMAVWADPGVTASIDLGLGDGSFQWSGSIYAPGARIRLAGTPVGGGTNGVVIGDTVTVSGDAAMNFTNPDPDNGGVSLMKVTLVE